jgi:probable F420-dependent oxidoreductase
MTVALAADDLQRASQGRFILGLGTQVKAHIERRFSMPWSQPVERMREYVSAVRSIWRSWDEGEALSFKGRFYRHTLMTPMFDPGPNPFGAPRVFVAAVGAKMTRVAAEVADGVVVHSFTSARYLKEVTLPAIGEGLAATSRARADVEVAGALFIATGQTEAELEISRNRLRELIALYASTPAYRPVLAVHGWEDLQPALNDLARRGEWSQMPALVTDEMLESFGVVAPLDVLADVLYERYGSLLDRLTFAIPSGDELARYTSFVSEFNYRS